MFARARRQLTQVYALTAILLYVGLAVAIMVTVVSVLDREIDSDIKHVLTEFSEAFSWEVPASADSAPLDVLTAFGPVFLFAFSPEGEVVRNPRDLPVHEMVPGPDVRLVALRSDGSQLTRTVDGERFRLHLEPALSGDVVVGVLVAGRSLARRDAEVRVFATTLVVSGLVWAGLATGSAWIIAGRALRPVREAYARQEEFVSGAAHELRSPIGVIRAASDVGLRGNPSDEIRGLLAEINAVAQDAASLVDSLLELARIRPRGIVEGDACDMAEVVARELSRMDLLLREHDVRVIDDLARARVQASESDIARVTRALLENILQHTPRRTQVIVRTRQLADTCTLSVEDDGPGVPPEQIGTIFDVFSRGDEARRRERSRTGLGLAIVQSIATHYGGHVLARPPVLGTGLVIEVSLPPA